MSGMLITGGIVLDQTGERTADVRIADGVVAEVGERLAVGDGEDMLDASGWIVSPGFVDLHTHLGEPGREEAETIETGSRAAAKGGYTCVVAMPNTDPTQDSVSVIEFVRRQGGLIGQRVRSISQRFGPWGVAVRGTFTPRGGGYGVFGEGLAGLWRAARLDDRLADDRDALADRAVCIVGLAIDAQVSADEATEYAAPSKVEGAWFIGDVTRMDDQQHALSAILMTIPILQAAPIGGGHTAPSAWLWLIVVIAIINPVRAALSVPRRSALDDRLAITSLGGLAAAGALLGVGALSGSLLDIADASRPAIRLAAGGLLLLSAAVELATKPHDDLPALPGIKAALVPVAVPLVARPAMLVAGLSIVADHGLALYAGALALAIAGLTVMVIAPADTDAQRLVHVWVARLFSAIAIAGSVVLIADAVFDI